MNQSDHCTHCGAQKIVRVILKDGGTIEARPGETTPADPDLVFAVETCCSQCGIMYSMGSLSSPVELYW